MVFVSLGYYLFVAILIAVYYMLPIGYRWISLLIGSLSFYWHITNHSFFSFSFLLILALVIWALNSLTYRNERTAKILCAFSILFSAAPLAVIKEAPYFMWKVCNVNMPGWWIAPVGLSFFSLQLISYSIDVYRRQIEPQRNFFKFLLFVCFFPQIIQGPIPRYSQLSDQLIKGHRFEEKRFVNGFMLIIWGFFLKLCIADKAAVIVDTIFENYPAYQGAFVLVGGILYSFQLYADFLSCTTLAQGVSLMVGIELVDNFSHPYFATSIKDFWRRWHISLSSWLRDYIYIPLGGNKKGKVRKWINILLTFCISGMWHGAGLKFLFWGLLHGIYQVVGDLLMPLKSKVRYQIGKGFPERAIVFGERLITFFLVMLAWIIFRADYLKSGILMIKSIFTVKNPWVLTNDAIFGLGLSWKELVILIMCLMILLTVSKYQEKGCLVRDAVLKYNIAIRWCIYIGAILFVMILGTYGWGYDAKSFIYGGF